MTLTADQILALAPDAASAKAGSAQASLAKWSGLGGHAQALWGLCQGSGKEPYRAQIELAGPAFKCTCPSRKFPCKHGLGLYLLYAREQAAFSSAEAPAWVNDWLHSRAERSEKKAAKHADADSPQSPEDAAAKAQAQARRQDKRESNVEAGLDILETWLADLAREGLASLRAKPAADWNAMAARLVDTQAAGLAARLRHIGLRLHGSSAPGWEMEVARELAQLALLAHSYRRLATLPPALQHDVRGAIGWHTSTDAVLAEPGVQDAWHTWGTHTQDDGRVASRACYLRGQRSGRWAVLLQFSAGAQALPPPLLPGTLHQGTLHFYPGAAPLRAIFGGDAALAAAPADPAGQAPATALATLLEDYARALAANPFIDPYPMLLEQVTPILQAGQPARFCLVAPAGGQVPVDAAFRHGWPLHALAGGAPLAVFGLWNGYAFLPLSAVAGGRIHGFDGEHAR